LAVYRDRGLVCIVWHSSTVVGHRAIGEWEQARISVLDEVFLNYAWIFLRCLSVSDYAGARLRKPVVLILFKLDLLF
jgi:hypothetical protein